MKSWNMLNNGWEHIAGECPHCHASGTVERNAGIVLTSYPPQYQYRCRKCGEYWSAHNDEEAIKGTKEIQVSEESVNTGIDITSKDGKETTVRLQADNSILGGPYIGNVPNASQIGDMPDNFGWGRYGWICPKCGRVMAPDTPFCYFCSKSEQVTTDIKTTPVVITQPFTYNNTGDYTHYYEPTSNSKKG